MFFYKLSSIVRRHLKFGLVVVIAFSIFVMVLPNFKKMGDGDYELDTLDMFGENYSDFSVSMESTFEVIHGDVETCFNTLIHSMKNKSSSFAIAPNLLNTEVDRTSEASLSKILHQFYDILLSLEINTVIIEPSFLFCILRTSFQELLIRRNVNVSSYSNSSNTLTFGMLLQDALKLEKQKNSDKFKNSGFEATFVYTPVTAWMRRKTSNLELKKIPSHIFYIHESFNLHFVIFFERNNFLWHAELETGKQKSLPVGKDLNFGKYSGAFETFVFVPLPSQNNTSTQFYVPSNPHHFLFQIPNSRFLECDMSRTTNMSRDNSHPNKHPKLSVVRFNVRTIIVIHQLKHIFHPLLINFWIWSGTMLGWYRQCDIIPYTTDVDFAAWASEVEDLDKIIGLLENNNYMDIKERMGILEEALEFNIDCKNLRTDVFFMYKIHNGSWCSGHSPKLGYYFRYYYPHFTLCSAELLGEKVQVPCETEKVIINEYGENWSKPSSKWDYEISIRNRGPNIYWKKEILKDAYKFYK